ncbi:PKD-like family lipoprotein [Sphingobacterium faecale]|uniref:PKD family protein n=1 Tax=Sphingobacterium faecale TaxID=2803775 RepID=A0ABS1R7N5_9SPHI|nr:PKD-like family lipoprotein [Sphingobacterium faecale]MBL1410736.1 hypothetical protein [Sphingobacterium faecale]
MKKINIILFVVSGILGLTFSCSKDQGNYQYTVLNDIQIENVPSYYESEYLVDTLKISPVLSFSADKIDSKNLSYEWASLPRNSGIGSGKKILGSEKDLLFHVDLLPGTYDLYFKVTNNINNVSYDEKIELKVSTAAYEGWMVLSELNNIARLGMVSLGGNGSTHTIIPNALAQTEMGEISSPRSVKYCNSMGAWENIAIIGGQTTHRVNPAFFTWSPDKDFKYEMLDNTPNNNPLKIVTVDFFSEFLITEQGNLYFKDPLDGDAFTAPRNRDEQGNTFKAAPFVAYGTNTYSVDAIVFDTDAKRFLKLPYKSAKCLSIPDGPLFSYSTNKELLHMSNSAFNNADNFAIMKDNNSKYYLYRFNIGYSSITQTYFDIIHSEEIQGASHFAVHPTLGYIFFIKDGKLYEYDMNLRTAKKMADYGNKEVTLLKFNAFTSSGKYYKPIYKELELQLIVGVNDPSKSQEASASLILYEVPTINRDLILKKQYDNFPKIIDITYRERWY